MTLDQKIADLHTAIHRLETRQSQILLMLNLYGLDEDTLAEKSGRLEARLNELTQNGMRALACIDMLQAQIAHLRAGA